MARCYGTPIDSASNGKFFTLADLGITADFSWFPFRQRRFDAHPAGNHGDIPQRYP
jgi:hypothetical protein